MEDKIKSLPTKAQFQRRTLRLILTCVIVLIINRLATPGLNWSLWVILGLGGAYLFELIDYIIVKRNTKEE